MKIHFPGWFILIILILSLACRVTATQPADATENSAGVTTPASENATQTAGPTPDQKLNSIVVDTLEQEVYPFQANGNCSLGEAIWTITNLAAQDACTLPSDDRSISIWLAPGTYMLTEIDMSPKFREDQVPGAGFPVIGSHVTIFGNDAIIQRAGSKKFGIFQVGYSGDLTLENLTITGGLATGDAYQGFVKGGGAIASWGWLTLDSVKLIGNTAQNGGAIWSSYSWSVSINNSQITQNTAIEFGGGIDFYSPHNGKMIIQNSEISYNVASTGKTLNPFGSGGGGINTASITQLVNTQVVGNSATSGGGIYASSELRVESGSLIAENIATRNEPGIPFGGGGIRMDQGRLIISDSYILDNKAPTSHGGGILLSYVHMEMSNSVLAGNEGDQAGGLDLGIVSGGKISGSCIFDNKLLRFGDAEHVAANAIANNSKFAAEAELFDASGNWWGVPGLPERAVTEIVQTDPVLQAAPAICLAALPTVVPKP